MRWVWHVARIGEKRILIRKTEEERPVGRPRRRWVNNVKMDLRKICWGGLTGLIGLGLGPVKALVNTVMKLRVP
jgi:hypothetical protein